MRNRFDRQLSTLNDELIEMGSMIEKSITAAAGCKRFKTDFIRIKNDYGYGANRRPRFGYFRNHNCTGRPAVY